MVIDKFYVAYAWRKDAMPEDIREECDTYEYAERVAWEYLIDDDDSRVWINVDGRWYCVWGRDKDTHKLIVSDDTVSWISSYISDFE